MPQNWEKIYNEAVYAVFWNEKEIRFKVGKISSEIDEILTFHNAQTFAFLTACNPRSQKLSDAENTARQKELIKTLNAENLLFLTGYGTNEDESWEREESLFVLEVTEEKALEIARKFEQHAILFGARQSSVKLIWS